MFDELIGLVVAGVAVTATAIVGAVVSHRKKKGKQLENAGQGYHFDNDISEEEDDDGFDSHGRDRAGKSKSYYKEEVGKLQQALGTIKKRTDEKDFDSALLSIRKSLEKAIKLYLEHWNGSYRGENLYSLIDEEDTLTSIVQLDHVGELMHSEVYKTAFSRFASYVSGAVMQKKSAQFHESLKWYEKWDLSANPNSRHMSKA